MTFFSRFKIISQKIAASGGSGAAAVWGGITGALSNQTDLQDALDDKLNITDFPAQFTTELDGKTTADLGPSTDRNYVTDAELAVIQEVAELHSGSINIDFGTSGDFLTTTIAAPWITLAHKGKVKCEVFDDGTDHLEGEAALGSVLASINNIQVGVSFDILVASQHDTWGRYVVKYNEII